MQDIQDTYAITKSGSTFEITRPTNPSTGYSWRASTYDGLKIISSQVLPLSSDPNLPGSQSIQVWRVKAIKKGIQYFKAVYKRPWENISTSSKYFRINIIVM